MIAGSSHKEWKNTEGRTWCAPVWLSTAFGPAADGTGEEPQLPFSDCHGTAAARGGVA